MGLRYRDLMMDVVECAGPAPECTGCTQTAREPACTKVTHKANPNPRPNCPKGSGPGRPPKRALGDLDVLRRQLRSELSAQG